jgi:Flp pilus assembly protein CpaB
MQNTFQNNKRLSFCNHLTRFLVSALALVVVAGCVKQEAIDTASSGTNADLDVTVVKARFALRQGSACASDRLEEVTIKQSLAPPGAVHSAASIVGRMVAQEVPPGAIVRENDLIAPKKPASEPQKTTAPP